MLIDKLPSTGVWNGQRALRPGDYPEAQRFFRGDVANYLKGRFRIVGDRLFFLPPDGGIVLGGAPFAMGGPAMFQIIGSEPAFDDKPALRSAPDAATGSPVGDTAVTVGRTLAGPTIYTAIGLHGIPSTRDELLGYFQLEPLIANPAKGL